MKRRSFFKYIGLIAVSALSIKEMKATGGPSTSKRQGCRFPDGAWFMDGAGKMRVKVAGKWRETRWPGW